jgi:hypothetical protein
MSSTGSCHCGKTVFRFDAALAAVTVIDGKHLW